MNVIFKTTSVILFISISACTVKYNYVWKEYPISPEKISNQINFTEGKEINIIKGETDNSKTSFGKVGWQELFGSLQSLTDGIADQLTKELENKNVLIKNTAEKNLEITVNKSEFERGAWKNATKIEFTVKLGNGRSKSYKVRNSSPSGFEKLYNGVVALAVLDIINDPEVETYINR